MNVYRAGTSCGQEKGHGTGFLFAPEKVVDGVHTLGPCGTSCLLGACPRWRNDLKVLPYVGRNGPGSPRRHVTTSYNDVGIELMAID